MSSRCAARARMSSWPSVLLMCQFHLECLHSGLDLLITRLDRRFGASFLQRACHVSTRFQHGAQGEVISRAAGRDGDGLANFRLGFGKASFTKKCKTQIQMIKRVAAVYRHGLPEFGFGRS